LSLNDYRKHSPNVKEFHACLVGMPDGMDNDRLIGVPFGREVLLRDWTTVARDLLF
jgi:hypothetical protein